VVERAYIRKIKRGRGDGVWGCYLVEEDASGLWFFTPERTLYRGTTGNESLSGPVASMIQLIPASAWWFARWQESRLGARVAIDICTPGQRENNTWSYIDLELDLVKFTDGRVVVLDEDEFEEARQRGCISDDEASRALSTAQALKERLVTTDRVFDIIGWEKLEQYRDMSFEPLVTFPA
jgi:hypothetical protein